jgi:hypothetical protein
MLADRGCVSVTLPKCLGLRFRHATELKPVAINLQRLSVVDEYKDIIISDVGYSGIAHTDYPYSHQR